jgi:hypothetical protein
VQIKPKDKNLPMQSDKVNKFCFSSMMVSLVILMPILGYASEWLVMMMVLYSHHNLLPRGERFSPDVTQRTAVVNAVSLTVDH